jgi:hypothetical protein
LGLRKLLNRENPESGLTKQHDRKHKFKLRREKDDFGFHQYILQNASKGERIIIPRFLFDKFRWAIRDTISREIGSKEPAPFDTSIQFKRKSYFRVKSDNEQLNRVIIHEMDPQRGSTGFLSLHRNALQTLDKLLYDFRLEHPNDLLNRIISYHKLFQFTFVEGSESIKSDLALRKDVLGSVEKYSPVISKNINDDLETLSGEGDDTPGRKNDYQVSSQAIKKGTELFKSRLGEKSGDKAYKVDFETLFDKKSPIDSPNVPIAGGRQKSTKRKPMKGSTLLPILANVVKGSKEVPFKCEFTNEEVNDLRETFLGDRNSEFFIGFEIMDAIFKVESQLRTFQFPLYYMKVAIRESGRSLFIEPLEGGRMYLNHLGLANLISNFGKVRGGKETVDNFFKTLAAQEIEVAGKVNKVHLTRLLPVNEEIFDRTRELLLGFPGENGKGGLLFDLNVAGIECDLESVFIYKTPKVTSPITGSLDNDLNCIKNIALEYPNRFYNSLLGEFLTPETKSTKHKADSLFPNIWMPGALPKSLIHLMDKINNHDLVLLEGPPGTGKTYSIMNMMINCICSGKRLLVTTDKKGGIGALIEKLEDYVVGDDRESLKSKEILKLFRTSIKVIDEIPSKDDSLEDCIKSVKSMLDLENSIQIFSQKPIDELTPELEKIDNEMKEIKDKIQSLMTERLGPKSNMAKRVAPKRLHGTTINDIDQLVAFLKFMGNGAKESRKKEDVRFLIRRFIKNREYISNKMPSCYNYFKPPEKIEVDHINELIEMEQLFEELLKKKPRRLHTFLGLIGDIDRNPICAYLYKKWMAAFKPELSFRVKAFYFVKSLFKYPTLKTFQDFSNAITHQRRLYEIASNVEEGVWEQLLIIHEALDQKAMTEIPLSLEICRFTTENVFDEDDQSSETQSVQTLLETMKILQNRRDDLVKSKFLFELEDISRKIHSTDKNVTTNLVTSITAILDNLKTYSSIEEGASVLKDLQEKLISAFPIWVCRKQIVPFIFPTQEKLFDLVVVDEATQCKVDDALPLLYRAEKLMVVGDSKQTVLAKDSVIDDYLFNAFDLNEHLRLTQAHGIKGGGSHIFGLVKAIKQAAVMLEEHYRCPPDIISFSNEYVYDSKLKIMQWSHDETPASVIINHSEEDAPTSERQQSGQYKGIDTVMIDRFLEYVRVTLADIEKQSNKKINLETDVALCYFLLKNEPYVKFAKHKFLQKINRGKDVLDGAGAALQGKERDYIFYYWDTVRSNMQSFVQGDDEDKRKGELNVLMSRPKKKAFHYLHKNFASLNHHKATITDYLWKTLQAQNEEAEKNEFTPRHADPGNNYIPWKRYSGQLIDAILESVLKKERKLSNTYNKMNPKFSISVGNPYYKVDIVLLPQDSNKEAIGIVDLCAFDAKKTCADDIIEYYFQLQRAMPVITPIFTFIHEIADERTETFKILTNYLANK